MLIGGVLNGTDGAIRIVQAVHALNVLTVAGLVLVLVVAGVRVFNLVLVFVFRVGLETYLKYE